MSQRPQRLLSSRALRPAGRARRSGGALGAAGACRAPEVPPSRYHRGVPGFGADRPAAGAGRPSP
jgi:hypothetical protein